MQTAVLKKKASAPTPTGLLEFITKALGTEYDWKFMTKHLSRRGKYLTRTSPSYREPDLYQIRIHIHTFTRLPATRIHIKGKERDLREFAREFYHKKTRENARPKLLQYSAADQETIVRIFAKLPTISATEIHRKLNAAAKAHVTKGGTLQAKNPFGKPRLLSARYAATTGDTLPKRQLAGQLAYQKNMLTISFAVQDAAHSGKRS